MTTAGPTQLQATARTSVDPMQPEFCRVSTRRQDNADTFTLTLEAPGDYRFAPGQFNMLYVPGYGEVAISLSGDPGSPSTLVHTIREVGAVTRALGRITPGDWVGVRGPFGVGWPLPADPRAQIVVVAGGIGLAPLRPLILQALSQQHDLFLVYGARTPADRIFVDDLDAWSQHPNARVLVTVDRGDPEWTGHSGVVTKYIAALSFASERSYAYTCGPEIMMRFAARDIVAAGVAPERVFVSLERNMKCGIGHCGHCQLGPHLLCKSGPVLPYPEAIRWMSIREL